MAPKRGPKPAAPKKGGKKKYCAFCADKKLVIDYKDVNLLRKFGSPATARSTSAALRPPSRTRGRWRSSRTRRGRRL
jgi:hypothetical protein